MDALNYWQKQEVANKAAFEFPVEFGLRDYPGDRFSVRDAYVSFNSVVILRVSRKCGNEWKPFTKAVPAQIRREITV